VTEPAEPQVPAPDLPSPDAPAPDHSAPDLSAIGADIEWPDHGTGTAVRERLALRHDLGALADLAEWAAAARPPAVPGGFGRVHAIVLAAAPSPAATQLAESTGAALHPISGLPGNVPAALGVGLAAADAAVDSGADLLVVALRPTGVAAAAAVAVLTDTEPVKVLRRGAAATDPETWMATAVALRDLRRRCQAVRAAPAEMLQVLDDAGLAAATALLLRAAARRTPVVLDGGGAVAAALLAYEVQPRAVRWWVPADAGSDPATTVALNRLGQRAVLSLGSDVGDATAGLLAVLVVQAALRFAEIG
jgi:nicotinate-nucleotide--dimethylbenzimidazole phosphoribosyltransferase